MYKKLLVTVGVLALTLPAIASAQVTLRLSHQFSKGDLRAQTARVFAQAVEDADVGLNIQLYPASSLFEPKEQWTAMVHGRLDMSVYPLDYASGRYPAFTATLMPGLVQSYDRAQRLDDSKFMKMIKGVINDAGVKVLVDMWLAGGFVSKAGCITGPDSVDGLTMRAAGPAFETMLAAAGASITSMPSSQIYTALQTGVLDAANTSTASLLSYRIYEQSKCLTAPGDNALWFMYEPLLMSQRTWHQLSDKQQAAVKAAAAKAEAYFQEHARQLTQKMIKAYKEHGNKVVTMSDQEFQAWMDIAKDSAFKDFTAKVPMGQELINAALAVD